MNTPDNMNKEQLLNFIIDATILKNKFNTVADKLDAHNRNVNIANVVGNSVSVLGGGLAITGALLAPFTLGASAAIGIIGSTIAAGGCATAGGAKLVRGLIKKFKLDELNKEWVSFQQKFNITHEILTGDDSFYRDALAGSTTNVKIANLGSAIAIVAPSIGSGAAKVGGNAARVTAIATSPLLLVNALLLPLNIYDLVSASVDVHLDEGCEVGLVFRKVAGVLEKLIEEATKKLLASK